jgi:hypothetical protein
LREREAVDQPQQGGLPRSTPSHQRHHLTGVDGEGQVVEDHRPGRLRKGNGVELDGRHANAL